MERPHRDDYNLVVSGQIIDQKGGNPLDLLGLDLRAKPLALHALPHQNVGLGAIGVDRIQLASGLRLVERTEFLGHADQHALRVHP